MRNTNELVVFGSQNFKQLSVMKLIVRDYEKK